MNAPQSTSPRRRLQELLAIPDNQRTDEEWDELNELEISLAPGNREGAPDPNLRRPTPSTGIGGKPPRPPRPQGQQKQGGQKPGGQKQGGPKHGGQKQGGPKPGGGPKQSAQPSGQPSAQPSVQPNADVVVQASAEAKSGDDGQVKKPARKFRKRGPKPKGEGGSAAPAAGGESGGQSSSEPSQ